MCALVTGFQTCALPISETLDVASAQVSALALRGLESAIITAYDVIMPWVDWGVKLGIYATQWIPVVNWFPLQISIRTEVRRVGKECVSQCRSRRSQSH